MRVKKRRFISSAIRGTNGRDSKRGIWIFFLNKIIFILNDWNKRDSRENFIIIFTKHKATQLYKFMN